MKVTVIKKKAERKSQLITSPVRTKLNTLI